MARRQAGLGDTLETLFKKIGFENGEDCGCKERKEILNRIFPYRYNPRCLTEQEYKDWSEFKKNRTIKLEPHQVKFIYKTYSDVFNVKKEPCSGCNNVQEVLSLIDKLDKVHDTYQTT